MCDDSDVAHQETGLMANGSQTRHEANTPMVDSFRPKRTTRVAS